VIYFRVEWNVKAAWTQSTDVLRVGSLQRGCCYPHLCRCNSHLWSSLLPQPSGNGTVCQSEPVRHRSAGPAVPRLRVPDRLPLAVGSSGHVRTSGDPAGYQLRSGDGVVSQ